MKDRQTQSDDWIGEWIARQRDSLAQQTDSAHQSTDTNPADVLRRWLDTGQAYFEGLKNPTAQSGEEGLWGFGDPFNMSNALMGAWASAGMLRSSVAQQTSALLGRLPPIGLAREQTEAWRELAEAHARCEQIENELRAVLLKVQFDALDLLSERVRQRKPDQPIESFRALYDLWVECGEQVYSKLAHSDAYSKLQAELGNASMRLRTRMQVVIEQWLKQLDLPTRSELNSLHRTVRDLRVQIEQLQIEPLRARPQSRAKAKSKVKRVVRPAAAKRRAKSPRR